MADLPKNIADVRETWESRINFWRGVHWLLLVAGTIATVTAAMEPEFLPSVVIEIFKWTAPLAFVIQIGASPARHASAFNNAYRKLHPACILYEEGSLSVEQLVEALREGEAVLQCTDPY